jgi:hypothetical protein
VIAIALARLAGADGKPPLLVTMEEDPFYYDQIKAIIPDSLKARVDFRLSEKTAERCGSLTGLRYRNIPPHDYDFVFIDGPSIMGFERAVTFDADFLDIVRTHSDPRRLVALLDNRIPTMRILRRMRPEFRFRYRPLTGMTVIRHRDRVTE